MPKQLKITLTLIITLLVITGLLFLGFTFINTDTNDANTESGTEDASLVSQTDDSLHTELTDAAIAIIQISNPTPPQAALQLAYISTVYSEVYDVNKNHDSAAYATKEMMKELYPNNTEEVNAFSVPQVTLLDEEKNVLNTYTTRHETDGSQAEFTDAIPTGDALWIQRPDRIPPLSPLAGTWKRWNVEGVDFGVVDPYSPTNNPDLYEKELRAVQIAEAARGPVQIQRINYWGGTPGTPTPSGIWLQTWRSEMKNTTFETDEWIINQKILTQTMSDAFMEAWKVKYTYWTERPSMMDPSLQLAMADPDFPAYVSGHTTVSFAASTALSSLYPEQTDVWVGHAKDARDSRLFAGVHFPMDNTVGEKLGTDVGNKALQAFGKEPLEFEYTQDIFNQ